MKLLVIGATGGTGREIVKQALEHGNEVTALVRNPDKLGMEHPKLRVVKGDVTDYVSVEPAVAGQDAVLSALGTKVIRKNTIQSDGTRNLIRAMEKHGVRRFICETSLDVGDSKGQLGPAFRYLVRTTFLRNIFADKELQEQIIRSSSLDWVIVRPAMLTDGPRTGAYRAFFSPTETGKREVSRADVADFMLKQVVDDSFLRKTPGLSY